MIDLNLLFNNGNSKYYFLKILKTFKYIEDKELGKLKEFVDAFSYNQFKSKAWLINKLKDLNIFEDNLKQMKFEIYNLIKHYYLFRM